MLNLRKLKQDFSANILKEGKNLYDGNKVVSAKILDLDTRALRISAQVLGQYENTYEIEMEIDRLECETIDSNCDCPYNYDCQHIAAILYYLEANLDEILVKYSKDSNLEEIGEAEDVCEEKQEILEVVKAAANKEEQRLEENYQKEILDEYIQAASLLSKSPFFLPQEVHQIDLCEIALIFSMANTPKTGFVDFQLALRLPSRSKPLQVPVVKEFVEAAKLEDSIYISGKKYFFSYESFDEIGKEIAKVIFDHAVFVQKSGSERSQKFARLDVKTFGMMLASVFDRSIEHGISRKFHEDELPALPGLYAESIETPLQFSKSAPQMQVSLEYIKAPSPKVLLNPMIQIDSQLATLESVQFFECIHPGIVYEQVYYRFSPEITIKHLRSLFPLREVTIPEPLFGSFVENAIPELSSYAEVANREVLEEFVTLPYTGELHAICELSYLNSELDAKLHFKYDDKVVPASFHQLKYENLETFLSADGIVARNLVEEKQMAEDLFRDFAYDAKSGIFVSKSEKKIIEFMTDTIPRNKHRATFNCPQNLLDQFIYDESEFTLSLSETDRMDVYKISIKINGALKGVTIDRLWDCIVSKRRYLELDIGNASSKKSANKKMPKILVLDLEKLGSLVQIFDELGIEKLDEHVLERPIWSIANIDGSCFENLPVTFTMTKRLKEIRSQMLGEKVLKFTPIPKEVKAELRHYQEEGVNWLERIRAMFLNGILADDMGLGKTLQAIVAVTQIASKAKNPSLIVCPTSLLYNWKEEFSKFNPGLKLLIVDGMPHQRKKMISNVANYDVIITSYSLLQKDVEHYEKCTFTYCILDEAQHIKNRGTRNAKSVKQLKAEHRLILSGTPIENSLDELWSLFDFLMPGFLNSYDRFSEKYIRSVGDEQHANLSYLKKKVSPFILRRMKIDVLKDLPPVSEITYHTKLLGEQSELYKSYAESARNELVKLVERDGFDRVQIHVLATLTRLKQICCHPAIFAKENAETGDSAKYDMLLDLLQTLIDGNHKTVIFSQYTKMLQIMKKDFEKMGIRFSYLDGSSKNRLEIVNEFNDDPTISVFLVSLKAGGTGLNLVGADTVIHYDMWWNPAVESQATDRVYRLGQKQSVSVYKLVTKNTIEEKIVDMQNKKKGIVKKIVSCDDEAITKLTWEDVLELLQT